MDLINKLIVVDADKRLNIDQMLCHPFLKKEYEDKSFLEKIPCLSKDDEELYNIRVNLVKKYSKIKKISDELNLIKENENMDEELKRNDEEMLNLIKNKDNLQKEYDNCLKYFSDDISKFKKDSNDKNILFNSKLDFLETQIKNDIFNIKYYGYVEEEKDESDVDSSSSSSSEKEDE